MASVMSMPMNVAHMSDRYPIVFHMFDCPQVVPTWYFAPAHGAKPRPPASIEG